MKKFLIVLLALLLLLGGTACFEVDPGETVEPPSHNTSPESTTKTPETTKDPSETSTSGVIIELPAVRG